jgi:hypothetical protein
MTQPPPVLDVDLLIERGGHQLKPRGSGACFAARFPTLLSLFHFLRIAWPFRKRIPQEAASHVEWRRTPIASSFESLSDLVV